MSNLLHFDSDFVLKQQKTKQIEPILQRLIPNNRQIIKFIYYSIYTTA